MYKNIIASKRTVSCEWRALSDSQASALLTAVKANTYGSLNYPDPLAGTNTTKIFYTGTPSVTMLSIESNNVINWTVSIDFVER